MPGEGQGRVFGYIRNGPQEPSQVAKEQRERILELYPGAEVFHDGGVGGGSGLAERPALVALLRQIARGDRLVVTRRERLTSDLFLDAWLEKQAALSGFVIESLEPSPIAASPTSKLLRQVAGAFADFERALFRSRTRVALRDKRQRGERVGGVPYGFRLLEDGRTLVPDEAQQAVIARIMRMHRRLPGLRRIARKLNEDGIESPRGKAWNPVTVSKIIRREEENAYEGARSRAASNQQKK